MCGKAIIIESPNHMEVLGQVHNHPVVIGLSPGSDACTANQGDVKVGVALALFLPVAGRTSMWNPQHSLHADSNIHRSRGF